MPHRRSTFPPLARLSGLPAALALVGLLALASTSASCARKSGCPVNDEATSKVNRKGEFSKKKSSSNLFPKDMRKRMKG